MTRTRSRGAEVRPVLVVDDDLGVCAALEQRMRRSWRVHTCNSFAQAVAWLADSGNTCDAALLDLQLGDGWGPELSRGLAAAPRLCAGWIAMTGLEGTPDRIAAAFSIGAHDFLEKPFHRDALDSALAGAFDRTDRFRARLAATDQACRQTPATSQSDDLVASRLRTARRILLLDDHEAAILRALIVEELGDKEIAHRLDCSESKVKRHEAELRARFGVSSRVGLAKVVLSLPPTPA